MISDYILSDIPPKNITEVQSGINYPSFKKYSYYSSAAERETNVNVLLPADYSEKKKYPVLYLLHGYFNNEDQMTDEQMKVSVMLTNLCNEGEAKEMIVVCPYIYCSKEMPLCTGMNLENSLNYDNFINDLTADLMPFIENSFSAAKGRENTAISGFSMGGREALFIGFSLPERFGYIGAACPAPGLVPVKNSPMHPGQMRESDMRFTDNIPFSVLVTAGENDGFVNPFPESYHRIMETNGTRHLWHIVPSGGHDHTSVVPHLYNFFRIIFNQ